MMLEHSLEWLRSFVPQPNTLPRGERMRAVAGALVGLFVTAILSDMLTKGSGIVFNNLTGRRYPHNQKSALRTAQQAAHATRDPAPMARLGFTAEDLDAVLARYGQVLDVSRDDLEDILLQTEQRAYA